MDRFLGMDFVLFQKHIEEFMPEATIEKDNDGQLVIYTNLRAVTSDEVPTMAHGDVQIERFGT